MLALLRYLYLIQLFFQVFWWVPVVVVEICKLRRTSTKLWASGQGMPIQFWMFGIYPESNCFDSEILGVISPGKELGQINQISGLKNWKKTLCVSYFRFDCSFQICICHSEYHVSFQIFGIPNIIFEYVSFRIFVILNTICHSEYLFIIPTVWPWFLKSVQISSITLKLFYSQPLEL